jgi:paired amphipathic helix protein Sin3a
MGGQQPDRGGVSMPDAPIKYEPQGPLPGGNVPMAPGGPAAQPQPYRQLKVEDALAYLDQVKMKFEKQPQIYNKFLDIMKEFKAQSIDTPGVIDRVLNLFFGHRELILGFNTFLPPGYKIEFSEDENKPRVQLKYPPGMTGPQPQGFAQMNAAHAAAAVQAQVQQPVPLSVPHGAAGVGPVGYDRMGGQPMDTAPPGPPAAPANKKAPIEFDQAINYVTKIKTRFAKQPETYKAFLEILHTYQKEQKTIKEVYEQVSHLFKSHTDLLSEFSQFLPDGSPEAGGLLGGSKRAAPSRPGGGGG